MTGNAPFPPGSSLAAYVRDSGGERQELSTEQQVAAITGWAGDNGYTISTVFADVARSGGSMAGRDQFDRMIKHFTRGASEAGVVFWDLSRWARDYDDGSFYLSTLRRLGYAVHSLEQYIPPGSIGRVVESLHLWSAEEYRKQLSRNVKRGLYYVVSVHHAYPRPDVPVGYRKYPVEIGAHRNGQPHIINRLEPDPISAPRVTQAFGLRAAGLSLSEIHAATGLYHTRYGYQHMLRNRIYIGTFVYGDLSIADFCQPLISSEVWRAVQEINHAWETDANHPRRAASSYLLSGLVRCALCGRAMTGSSSTRGGKRYRYYACTARHSTIETCGAREIPAGLLEEAVSRLALEFISDDNLLQQLVEAVRIELTNKPDESGARLEQLQSELGAIDKAIRNILETLEMSGASRTLAGRLAELERGRDDLADKLAAAERQQAARRGFDPDAVSVAAQAARLRLAHVDPRERQLALRSVVREVRAAKDGGTVIFSLPGGIDTSVDFCL